MIELPINDVLPEITASLDQYNRAVIQAPPGAGKTTAIPLALLHEAWLENRQIILLEPRRVAARNAAYRMSELLGEQPGETVGYHIRQDKCMSSKTRILVVTEGILTRKLQSDPELSQAGLVIFDEFHERSIHADLSLALCLQSQQILRPELKILIMSATLNTDAITRLLSDNFQAHVPLVESRGRSYPVDIYYESITVKHSNNLQLIAGILQRVKQVIKDFEGNCLVFLPGVKEINQLENLIKQYISSEKISRILVTPLHGSLTKKQQDRALVTHDNTLRKIVLATNIAETSLTIEGIDCVIDSGLERILEYNPANGMNQLKTRLISHDSADQRSGRAGRLSAGTCYRLWSHEQHKRLQKHSTAEILHSDLSSLVLELANWGTTQVNELHWLDKPEKASVNEAKTLLRSLNAIDEHDKITAHGQQMLQLGSHPRLSHMILCSIKLEQTYHACLLAGLLTERDIFVNNAIKSYEIHDRLNVLTTYINTGPQSIHSKEIDKHQCNRIITTANDFLQRIPVEVKSANSHRNEIIKNDLSGVLLAYAYPDRIAKQRADHSNRYLLSNGRGAIIPDQLQGQFHKYIVIASLDARLSEARVYLASDINRAQIEDYFHDQVESSEHTSWNDALQRVESKSITQLGKIILNESNLDNGNTRKIQDCLLQAIRKYGLSCLNWSDKATRLQQRLVFIHHQINSSAQLKAKMTLETFADYSEKALLKSIDEWFRPYLTNQTSIKQCQKLDIYTLLLNQLSWEQQKEIDRLAPESIIVPSGSNIKIDYSDPAQPILAVRLQEVFGLLKTPCILNDQCKLMMHLLSPAHRPMQVTQDLGSFWKTTYHDVKKELRGKYKKHYWPDDPYTAQATNKTRKNMKS